MQELELVVAFAYPTCIVSNVTVPAQSGFLALPASSQLFTDSHHILSALAMLDRNACRGVVGDEPEVHVVQKDDTDDQRANGSPPSCFRSDRSHRRQLYPLPLQVSYRQEEACFSDVNQANETKHHANPLASRGRRRPRGQHARLDHVAAHFRFCSRRQSVRPLELELSSSLLISTSSFLFPCRQTHRHNSSL